MSERLRRLAAVAQLDLRLRLRRPVTVAAFLALCFSAYLWVPDPSTGRALMVVGGQRALYDSETLAFATGLLCSFLLGLVGYYLVSHSIRGDLETRCGLILASTPLGPGEYLVGKALGHTAFLAVLAAGYLVSSMAMQAARGEGPVALGPYLATYGLLVPPAILFAAAAAVLFETRPRLAGRLGDVTYFFLWLTVVGLATAGEVMSAGSWTSLVDFAGFGVAAEAAKQASGSPGFAIGASAFDASAGTYTFPGIALRGGWIVRRFAALLVPAGMLALAVAGFHRFDPDRVRLPPPGAARGWIGRAVAWPRPLVAWAVGPLLAGCGPRPSLCGAALADGALTLLRYPLAGVALLAGAVAAPVLPAAEVAAGLLPAILATLGLAVADLACREDREGTLAWTGAAPSISGHHLAWKCATGGLLGLAFTLAPAVRLAASGAAASVTALLAGLSVALVAVALATLTRGPKAFTVLYLVFLYLVLDDAGRTPALDFAGFSGRARPAVALAYLAGALLLLCVAWATAALRVARR